jgi:hypothetical protein
MPQKTTRIEKRTYLVYEAGNLHWKILVRKDSNSTLYVPVYRKGWQDGGEVEIMWNTLTPHFTASGALSQEE